MEKIQNIKLRILLYFFSSPYYQKNIFLFVEVSNRHELSMLSILEHSVSNTKEIINISCVIMHGQLKEC